MRGGSQREAGVARSQVARQCALANVRTISQKLQKHVHVHERIIIILVCCALAIGKTDPMRILTIASTIIVIYQFLIFISINNY